MSAIILTAALAVVALIWNLFVGLSFHPSIFLILSVPAALFLIAGYYAAYRPREIFLRDVLLYAGLWLVYPIFGTRLSYLAATLDFPLRDAMLQTWDHAIGFNWLPWATFVYARPWLAYALIFAYASYAIQPFITVAILCKWGPKNRNAEFLTSILVALIVTIILSALLPALSSRSPYPPPHGPP